MLHRVFIAYSRTDKPRMSRLRAALEHAGIGVVVDVALLRNQSGERWQQVLLDEVSRAHVLVLLLTEQSAGSQHVRDEFLQARTHGVPIVPVVVGTPTWEAEPWSTWLDLRDLHCQMRVRLDDTLLEKVVHEVRNKLQAHVVAFFNMKGGVGKTTLAAHFAARTAGESTGWLSRDQPGSSVLMVDLDPQQSLTELFVTPAELAKRQRRHHSLIGFCEPRKFGVERIEPFASPVDTTSVSEAPPYGDAPVTLRAGRRRASNRFDLLVGDFEAIQYGIERSIAWQQIVENFKRGLHALRSRYDLIVLDCNPSVTPLTYCAMHADHLVVPLTLDDLGRRGAQLVQRFADKVQQGDKPMSVVLNRVPAKPNSDQRALLYALERGEEELIPGARWVAEHRLPTSIPDHPGLVAAYQVPRRSAGASARAFVQRRRSPRAMRAFVEELQRRLVEQRDARQDVG